MTKKIGVSIFCLLMVFVSVFVASCQVKTTIEKYDIEFIVDGESYHTINTSGNEVLEFPLDPTKTGYEFEGWYLDNDVWSKQFTSTSYENQLLTEGVSIYAKFDLKEYTITYQNTKGATNPNVVKFTMNSSDITISDLSLDGYTFTGWYDAVSGGNKVEKIASGTVDNQTLYARWDSTMYSITYENAEGFEELNPASYTVESDEITLVNPIKERYIFLGWFDAEVNGNKVEKISGGSIGDKILYARWADYILNITYNTEKQSVRDSEEINADLFNVICKDNLDQEIDVQVTYEGKLEANSNINVVLTATSNGVTVTERIENIGVVETPNITSMANKHLYSDDNLNLLFNCNYKDESIVPTTHKIVSGEMKEGQTVVIRASVTDSCGVYSKDFTYSVLWEKAGLFTHDEATLTGLTTLGIGMSVQLVIPYELDGTLITNIGYQAFKDNYVIKYLETPSCLEEIGREAFYDTNRISEINFGEGLKIIGWDSFYKNTGLTEVTLPESLTTVGARVFEECTNLKSIIIPKNVTNINNAAFWKCTSLEKVEFLNKSVTMADNIFYGCTSLTDIKLPTELKTLGESVFYNCTSLTEITFPETLEKIGNSAFKGCTSLRSIYVPSTVTTIEAYGLSASDMTVILCEPETRLSGWENSMFATDTAFIHYGINETSCYYDGKALYQTQSNGQAMLILVDQDITEYEIPAEITFNGNTYSVVELSGYSFVHTPNLKEIVIPSTITTLNNHTFKGCPQLIVYLEASSEDELNASGTWYGDAQYKYGYKSDNYYFDGTFEYMIDQLGTLWITSVVEDATMVVVPSTVTFGGETRWINSISNNVFRNKKNLMSVYLPAQYVCTKGMFEGCSNLVVYTDDQLGTLIQNTGFTGPVYSQITESNYYYDGTFEYIITYSKEAVVTNFNLDITDVNIPTSITFGDVTYPVTQIGTGLFTNRDNIINVTLPTSITTLAEKSFANCPNLKSVTLNEGLKTIEKYAFYECKNLENVYIPSTLEKIGIYLFAYCESLESIDLTSKLSNINAYAFMYSGLKTITIPENVKYIDDYAFYGCNDLEEIYIPKSIEKIYSLAVGYGTCIVYMEGEYTSKTSGWCCNNKVVFNYKESIIFKDKSLTYQIKDGKAIVISGDKELGIINIPASIQYEGNSYPVVEIGSGAFANYSNLAVVNIENGLTKIGYSAFMSSKEVKTSLIRVNIPNSVIEIGTYAFYYCTKLTEIDLPSQLQVLGDSSFEFTGIKTITIPETLSTLNNNAFYGSALSIVIIPETVTTMGQLVFCTMSNNLTIYCYVDGPQEGWNKRWYSTGGITVVYNYNGEEITE